MARQYDIELRLDGENAISDPVPDLTIGDTVRYFSCDGEASVEFAGPSPFESHIIGDRQTVVVQNVGDRFRGLCFITKDGIKRGWKHDPSPSGVDHTVKPPR